MKKCTVERPNLWTSLGKSFRGDEIELPDDEAEKLKDAGAVSVKRGRKKAETPDAQ